MRPVLQAGRFIPDTSHQSDSNRRDDCPYKASSSNASACNTLMHLNIVQSASTVAAMIRLLGSASWPKLPLQGHGRSLMFGSTTALRDDSYIVSDMSCCKSDIPPVPALVYTCFPALYLAHNRQHSDNLHQYGTFHRISMSNDNQWLYI